MELSSRFGCWQMAMWGIVGNARRTSSSGETISLGTRIAAGRPIVDPNVPDHQVGVGIYDGKLKFTPKRNMARAPETEAFQTWIV